MIFQKGDSVIVKVNGHFRVGVVTVEQNLRGD